MKTSLKLSVLGVCCSFATFVSAQTTEKIVKNYITESHEAMGILKSDCADWILSNENTSDKFGITYAYVNQRYQGIEIHNAIANFAIKEGVVTLTGNRFEKDIANRVNTSTPAISETEAIVKAANALGLTDRTDLQLVSSIGNNGIKTYSSTLISNEEIPVELCFSVDGKSIRLAWNLSIHTLEGNHWWSIRLDAITGEIINKNDWYVSCEFDEKCTEMGHDHGALQTAAAVMMPSPPPSTDTYNVFAVPVESPNHGARTLEVGPSDPVASPFGWHDDDGVAGAEYTITRGNNVYATEDTNDDNNPGYAPDGGPSLNFDFPLNLNQVGTGFWDPAITNLFYFNNMMHDVWYHYGFDEASGNFQQNNYGNGGAGSDYVNADAQDGSGTNNANFGTPPDGSNPRMQMYLWTNNGSPKLLQINSPVGISGLYSSLSSSFGPGVPAVPVTADFVVFNDGTGDESDACENAVNGAALNGKIAIIRRGGGCNYVDKVVRAESEGAVGVIVVNNVSGGVLVMGGTDPGISIPAIMVTMFDGENIISEIENGATVNGSIGDFGPFDLDSDFDNGIIAHEYGHGISNRLTGGGNNTDCLYNEDQMGEGWSDWFSLMMTLEPGDQGTDARGIGTYASAQPINGGGIRPAPYSTDWTINNYTYGVSNNTNAISQPHGIGFIWCTTLWDLTWALIDKYGFDPDIYNGTGGNNVAMHIIMNGMKMQPCQPGSVDGRDAILAADVALYNGENQCLIWEVFANRGLGYSADQGSTNDRTDQIQAFDLPPALDHVTNVTVSCEDYVWPVNGQTYSTTGTYYASITPNSTCDSIATLNLTVNNSINSIVTYNGPTTLVCTVPNVNYQWLNCAGDDTIIPGATSQSFSPTENGLYAVIASQGTCVDTSVCIFVNQINGLDEFDFESLTVYPNPTNGTFTIDFGASSYSSVEVTITNALGQVVSEANFENSPTFDMSINGTTGIYFVIIRAENRSSVVKIVKE